MARTGYKVTVYLDDNPDSPTYGQTYEERVYDTEHCPIEEDDLVLVGNECEIDMSGYTGYRLMTYYNRTTGEYVSVREEDAECEPSSTEEQWVNSGSPFCETTEQGLNTGYMLQLQVQMNQALPSYGTTRYSRYKSPDCALNSCASWDDIQSQCHISVSNCVATFDGTEDVTQIDVNPLSETYNTTRTINREDTGDCQNCTETTFSWVEVGEMCGDNDILCAEGITENPTSKYLVERKYKTIGSSEPVAMGEYRLTLVEEDVEDCGYIPPQYKWEVAQGQFLCDYETYTKYQMEVRWVSYDSGVTWSVDADTEPRRGAVIEEDSYDCGKPMYRWVENGEYVCVNDEVLYRWYQIPINEDYMCYGTAKYYKEVYQQSIDGGNTWSDVVPAQYRMGELYNNDSSDCKQKYDTQYFTIEVYNGISSNRTNITFTSRSERTISASTDNGASWTEYTSSGMNPTTIARLEARQKVIIKGLNGNYFDWHEDDPTVGNPSYFRSNGHHKVYGNIMSLVYGDSFTSATGFTGNYNFAGFFANNENLLNAENLVLPETTLTEWCYGGMFDGCTRLLEAPSVLPATTLASHCYDAMFARCPNLINTPELPATTMAQWCYGNMFASCTRIAVAPELPATILAPSCYACMFDDCTSLTEAPELPATTLARSCYSNMFSDCTSLTEAPELPATTLANYCYETMFRGCTSLTSAPELPATTLANSCYQYMFADCTSLTEAPELPSTALVNGCYRAMFNGCTSLTETPELPAIQLVSQCYIEMFAGCTSLNYIKAMFATTPSTSYTNNWVDGVSATGTFVKNSAAQWDVRGTYGIPSGWTVQNA